MKALLMALVVLAGIGVLAKSQAPEIQRYLKMKAM
jgi:hypothetical protein